MLGTSIERFIKYNVPDDGACGLYSIAISLMVLVRKDQYRFSEMFKDYFKKNLKNNILDIVNYKLNRQNNLEVINFNEIISPEFLNSVFDKLSDETDLNQFLLSIDRTDELYAFMYILAAIWIHFLQNERNLPDALDECGDSIMWEIAKFMDLEFETYSTLSRTSIHRHYRDSIYTKSKIIVHFDLLAGHIEPLIPEEIKIGFIELLSSNSVIEIDRNKCAEQEVFWWGYASRLANCIKPLIFSSKETNDRYLQIDSNDPSAQVNLSSSSEVAIKF